MLHCYLDMTIKLKNSYIELSQIIIIIHYNELLIIVIIITHFGNYDGDGFMRFLRLTF